MLRALVYISGSAPTPEEASGAELNVPEGYRLRNARYWRGETEPCSACYAESEEIRAAYDEAGISARPLFSFRRRETAEAGMDAPVEAVADGSAIEEEPTDSLEAVNARADATGSARALANEHGIRLSDLYPGSGPDGRIYKDDVEDAISQ